MLHLWCLFWQILTWVASLAAQSGAVTCNLEYVHCSVIKPPRSLAFYWDCATVALPVEILEPCLELVATALLVFSQWCHCCSTRLVFSCGFEEHALSGAQRSRGWWLLCSPRRSLGRWREPWRTGKRVGILFSFQAFKMAVRVDVMGLLRMATLTSLGLLELPATATDKAEMNSEKPSDFVDELWRASGLSCPALPVLVPYLSGSVCCSNGFWYLGYCVAPDKELTVCQQCVCRLWRNCQCM